eukprot:scaffold211_cov83-Skeletonema_dohrnii-CCMP3373.AAC.1
MAAEGDHIRRVHYNYTGADDEVPDDATHVTIAASVRVIPEEAFRDHRNIVEVIFDVNVKKVEEYAFNWCPSLRRVIMPGVEIVEYRAFDWCRALTDVECGKLERIERGAFCRCKSLRSIDLPSAKIVERDAFYCCEALADVKFGSKLDRIGWAAFGYCESLERITIPLKDGLITYDSIFRGCSNLKHVDLVEAELHETIAALQFEEWRNDIFEEINAINQILPTVDAGGYYDMEEKAREIRTWIRSVLGKIVRYKAKHQRLLDEAATSLQLALPRDIVMNNVLPFLELPSYTFELENHEEEEGNDGNGRREFRIIWHWQEGFDSWAVKKESAYLLFLVVERETIQTKTTNNMASMQYRGKRSISSGQIQYNAKSEA